MEVATVKPAGRVRRYSVIGGDYHFQTEVVVRTTVIVLTSGLPLSCNPHEDFSLSRCFLLQFADFLWSPETGLPEIFVEVVPFGHKIATFGVSPGQKYDEKLPLSCRVWPLNRPFSPNFHVKWPNFAT